MVRRLAPGKWDLPIIIISFVITVLLLLLLLLILLLLLLILLLLLMLLLSTRAKVSIALLQVCAAMLETHVVREELRRTLQIATFEIDKELAEILGEER